MKRFIAAVLCIVMCLSLVACTEKKIFDINAAEGNPAIGETGALTDAETPADASVNWCGYDLQLRNMDTDFDLSFLSFVSISDSDRFIKIEFYLPEGVISEEAIDQGTDGILLTGPDGHTISATITLSPSDPPEDGSYYFGLIYCLSKSKDYTQYSVSIPENDLNEAQSIPLSIIPLVSED